MGRVAEWPGGRVAGGEQPVAGGAASAVVCGRAAGPLGDCASGVVP